MNRPPEGISRHEWPAEPREHTHLPLADVEALIHAEPGETCEIPPAPPETYTGPAWLAGVNEAEREELAALGVPLDVPPTDAAALDAHVAMLLRAVSAIDRDVARYEEAEIREKTAIGEFYSARIGPLAVRRDFLVRTVERIALRADFGKKKSRATPWGTYGRKQLPAKLEIADAAALVAWAEEHAPYLVRVVATLPLPEALEYFSEDEIAKHKREVLVTPLAERYPPDRLAQEDLPPGVTHVAARDVPVVKPNPAAPVPEV